ncbi:hypothetical protein [Roseococcus pinisoli]|uniref:TMhelix containing protein n=1 Tax=Roseococcus pinisoli TaxID=2835040 RepID=A0ABS5QJ05_9PROT|nr:hypothetical protein [Roseococcus pinisoli]MBS7813670.1 hypothetical protein [Roseococcus pinisoli]
MELFDFGSLSGAAQALLALAWAGFLGVVVYVTYPIDYETEDEAFLAAWCLL